jgi:hypothetical protein
LTSWPELCNPKTGFLDYSKGFTNTGIRSVDPKAKTLFSFGNGGRGKYHEERYAVEENLPVLIWSQEQNWDDSKQEFHCTRQERRNGKILTLLDAWNGCPAHDSSH